MNNLGISVYPDIKPIDEIKDYIELAHRYGFNRVFTSVFNIEDSKETVIKYFTDLCKVAHDYDMEVSLDVHPASFDKLGAKPSDIKVFHEMGADILRMDMAYGDERDVELLNNPYGIKIEFNASFLQPVYIESLLSRGINKEMILACHNFYPQRYTGMKWDKFKAVNKKLHQTGIKIGAFISSNADNTHGVWDARDGLPTVERLRNLPIETQLKILLATENVDDILIGNAFASEEEFQAIQNVMREEARVNLSPFRNISAEDSPIKIGKTVKVNVKCEDKITDIEREVLFGYYPHVDIGDSSEWIWRSRMPRFVYREKNIPHRVYNEELFSKGDVVMVNNNYQNYKGEVQIVLEPIVNDGDRNLVARISEDEMLLLELIEDRDIVIFTEKGEKS